MIMVYVIEIHGKKRPMNLVLIIHKETLTQGLHSVKDVKTCFRCNQKAKHVKNYGFSQKLR